MGTSKKQVTCISGVWILSFPLQLNQEQIIQLHRQLKAIEKTVRSIWWVPNPAGSCILTATPFGFQRESNTPPPRLRGAMYTMGRGGATSAGRAPHLLLPWEPPPSPKRPPSLLGVPLPHRAQLQGTLVEVHQHAGLLGELGAEVLQAGGVRLVHDDGGCGLVPGAAEHLLHHHLAPPGCAPAHSPMLVSELSNLRSCLGKGEGGGIILLHDFLHHHLAHHAVHQHKAQCLSRSSGLIVTGRGGGGGGLCLVCASSPPS